MAAFHAHGSFHSWIGIVREPPGRYAWPDVYAGMSIPSERLINVFNANIVSNQCTFVNGNSVTTGRWRPALGESIWSDTDSFVTLGGFSSRGTWYCGDGTSGDATFDAWVNFGSIVHDFRTFAWIPAPGGIAALALMPFVSRGRRR